MSTDDLERRLAAALHRELDDAPIATSSLVAGARSGATRIRRRRRVSAAVAVTVAAVVAVPFGLQRAGLTPSGPETPNEQSVQIASPDATGDVDGTTATAAPSPAHVPTAVAEFPDDAVLRDDDLGQPMRRILDLGSYSNIATVDGQSCDAGSRSGRPRPTAGRSWSWVDQGSERTGPRTVALNLTAWDDAGAAIQDVRQDTGFCAFLTPVTERPSQDEDAARDGTRWVGSTTSNGLAFGHAVVRVGVVLVAVTVQHPAGEPAAAREADRLVTLAVQRATTALG